MICVDDVIAARDLIAEAIKRHRRARPLDDWYQWSRDLSRLVQAIDDYTGDLEDITPINKVQEDHPGYAIAEAYKAARARSIELAQERANKLVDEFVNDVYAQFRLHLPLTRAEGDLDLEDLGELFFYATRLARTEGLNDIDINSIDEERGIVTITTRAAPLDIKRDSDVGLFEMEDEVQTETADVTWSIEAHDERGLIPDSEVTALDDLRRVLHGLASLKWKYHLTPHVERAA